MNAACLHPGLTMIGIVGSAQLLSVQISFSPIDTFQPPGSRDPFKPLGGEVSENLGRFADLMFGNIPFISEKALDESERIMRLAVDHLTGHNIRRSQPTIMNGWYTQFRRLPYQMRPNQEIVTLRAWHRRPGKGMRGIDPMLRGMHTLFKQIIHEEND